MLVELRKEIEKKVPSVLDGDVVVMVSPFTVEDSSSPVNLPPMRSVRFVEDNGNQSQRHFATLLTDGILCNAIIWLVGEEVEQVCELDIYLGRGCTGEFSKRKIFSKTFSSKYNVVDMVCRMNIHHERF